MQTNNIGTRTTLPHLTRAGFMLAALKLLKSDHPIDERVGLLHAERAMTGV